MIKEIFCYPKEAMDRLIVEDGENKVAVWTDALSPSVCYDFYSEAREDEPDRIDYKCARVRVPQIDYDTIVSAIIDVEYTNDKVQSLLSNYLLTQNSVINISDEKAKEYAEEWLKFQEFRNHAKTLAALATKGN